MICTSFPYAKQLNMKSDAIKKPLPANSEEWEQLIQDASGEDVALNPQEEQDFWDKAVVIQKGGAQAVSEALQAKRSRGQQKKPAKLPVSIRLSVEVVEYFKSTGQDWQTRMDEVLREYVNTRKGRRLG